jgi:hypothetical protein
MDCPFFYGHAMDKEAFKAAGAEWVGRGRPLTDAEFRHQFGVYPRTVAEISRLEGVAKLDPKHLLRALWWLKVYPTDVEIKNHRASDTWFRLKLKETLAVLKDALPEVWGCRRRKTRTLFSPFSHGKQLPFDERRAYNATYESLADRCAFILDTTTIKTYMPKMAHGDWERYGRKFWNGHKKIFGVKLEIAVATQRRPVPLACTVVPGGIHDMTIARMPGGVLSHVQPRERGLGDLGYGGEPDKIYAPPRRNQKAFVPELDKAELGLQRRVEMLNRHIKEFNVLGQTFRKGAVRAYVDLMVIGVVVAKLVFADMLLAQEHSGPVHTTGPIPDPPRPPKISGLVAGPGARFRLQKQIQEQQKRVTTPRAASTRSLKRRKVL